MSVVNSNGLSTRCLRASAPPVSIHCLSDGQLPRASSGLRFVRPEAFRRLRCRVIDITVVDIARLDRRLAALAAGQGGFEGEQIQPARIVAGIMATGAAPQNNRSYLRFEIDRLPLRTPCCDFFRAGLARRFRCHGRISECPFPDYQRGRSYRQAQRARSKNGVASNSTSDGWVTAGACERMGTGSEQHAVKTASPGRSRGACPHSFTSSRQCFDTECESIRINGGHGRRWIKRRIPGASSRTRSLAYSDGVAYASPPLQSNASLILAHRARFANQMTIFRSRSYPRIGTTCMRAHSSANLR